LQRISQGYLFHEGYWKFNNKIPHPQKDEKKKKEKWQREI
jgi:hypothetical protein